jgi:hypothetical protein
VSMPKKPRKPVQVRQGDVVLDPCEDPGEMVPVAPQGEMIVLAEGEATGHRHVVPAKDAQMGFALNGERYLRVVRPTTESHEEHLPPIPLAPGTYRVIRDREFDDTGIFPAVD